MPWNWKNKEIIHLESYHLSCLRRNTIPISMHCLVDIMFSSPLFVGEQTCLWNQIHLTKAARFLV